MIAFPNAKINIGLHITARRPDGYHAIESVFYPIGLADVLELVSLDVQQTELQCTGLPVAGALESNLIWKAWQLMADKYHVPPVKAHLHKVVPMGAGLGGGSADGAVMLQLLNNAFELGLGAEVLEALALELGSDCPFFVRNSPQIVTGRGELMEAIELDLSGYLLVLINPGIHIGTAEAYANVVPGKPDYALMEAVQQPVSSWRGIVENQFERSVFPAHPVLARMKEQLYEAGALYASMTGSGSTLYGVFDQQPTLETLAAWQVWAGKLK